ncbi:MAG: metallophosphoesterase [Candidatus Didemnitutus sp.]|nr:metallophosphoesterase [Candidatus Didemnitutus sp.]
MTQSQLCPSLDTSKMQPTPSFFLRLWLLVVALPLAVAARPEQAAPLAQLVVVHTNDIHDHVRPREDGAGGLPYVAGFVAQLRRQHGDVLVVDAGDVTEKGDLIGARTHGLITYEAMRRVGYHAVAIGNHDLDRVPLERLRRHEKALGQRLLCANLLGPDDQPLFEPARLVRIGEVQVGLVGLTLAAHEGRTREGLLDLRASGRRLAHEARALRAAGADVVVAVCHEGTKACAELSQLAPEVALFVSAHTHEIVRAPIVVPGTGALVVQASSYARWAGLLKLEVDRRTGRIVRYGGSLVEMTGEAFAPDPAIQGLVAAAEGTAAPDASVFVIENERSLTASEIGLLGAEALRTQTGAEIGFCLPSQVVRDVLPAGRLDYNSFYRAVGLIGANLVAAELSGAEIAAYFTGWQRNGKERPEWAGFRAQRTGRGGLLQPELEPTRRYRVVMPKREWGLVMRQLKSAGADRTAPALKERAQRLDASLAGALRDYLSARREQGQSLREVLAELEAARSPTAALTNH